MLNFQALIVRTGSVDGARAIFEELLAQLMRLAQPGVRRVEANPGDWGIDVFVGQLDGLISVWQCKFFIDGVGKSQQGEIRDSLKSLMKNATAQGFKVDIWTLCIPCSMDPAATLWWDKWKKKAETEHSITIELWDETELRDLLLSPDAATLREVYFGLGQTTVPRVPLSIRPVPEGMIFDNMLFVKQLLAARVEELDAAKEEFFNHDLLAREVTDKGVEAEVSALQSAQSEVRSLWSSRFNKHCAIAPSGDQLPGLHGEVMSSIENVHTVQPPKVLPMSIVHRFGSVHHLVENGQAGWVRNFRDIAKGHNHGCS